tara:strand:+ start:497 stop:706 length:210 start_codon:yes stop_codon:yes gene_type:complete
MKPKETSPEKPTVESKMMKHVVDVSKERDELKRQNDKLIKFINQEMRMSAGDPRLIKLAEAIEGNQPTT